MPYIITTRKEYENDAEYRAALRSRRAVATLFEAREEAAYRIEQITGGDEDYEEVYTDAQNCSELGETFGPLADGSEVKVEPWTDVELAVAAGLSYEDALNLPADQIIDAYNDH